MSGLLNDPTMAPDFLVLLGAWNTTHINTSISCLAFPWNIILKLYISIFKCYASPINSPVEKAAHEQAYIHSTTACSIFNKCLLRIYTNIPRAVKEGKFPSYTIRQTLTQHKQSLSLASAHHWPTVVLVGGPCHNHSAATTYSIDIYKEERCSWP